MNSILVTGGAGYIGSHAVLALLESGYRVVVLDNLSTGHREVVPAECQFVYGDAGDGPLVMRTLRETGVDAVMHFAGSIIVEESVSNPLKYYRNNTEVSRSLIQSCIDAGVHKFIFSSTAAVYGNAETVPVTEACPVAPINPYGMSKAMTELVLKDVAAVTPLSYVILRYFNVAGADPGRRTGLLTKNATHLLKVACETALGKRDQITVFGDDYPTRDGTCIRDFIHVSDLAAAHVRALEYLKSHTGGITLNCGYGTGYSVREVLTALEKVMGKPMNIKMGPRRPGDAAAVVADSSRLRALLNWEPRYNNLPQIITDAVEWEKLNT